MLLVSNFSLMLSVNNFPVQTVEVRIEFPQPATFPEVRAWAHGPLWGELLFLGGNLKLAVSPLPARNYWEVRTVFPLTWVPSGTRVVQQSHLDVVLKEEEAWARQANLERQQAEERMKIRKEQEAQATAEGMAGEPSVDQLTADATIGAMAGQQAPAAVAGPSPSQQNLGMLLNTLRRGSRV